MLFKQPTEKRLRPARQLAVHYHHLSRRLKRWPSVMAVGDLLLRASLGAAHWIQPPPQNTGAIRVTDGIICWVEPSDITDLHAVVRALNIPQIFHNGLKHNTKVQFHCRKMMKTHYLPPQKM